MVSSIFPSSDQLFTGNYHHLIQQHFLFSFSDDTALNNVDIVCCDVPSPAKSCTPKERWEFVAHCDNTAGTEVINMIGKSQEKIKSIVLKVN